MTKPSSHRIQDPITDDDDAELSKSVITGKDENDVFRNVNVTEDGYLAISDNSDGLSIAEGNVLQIMRLRFGMVQRIIQHGN
jgi:hypothetical protein